MYRNIVQRARLSGFGSTVADGIPLSRLRRRPAEIPRIRLIYPWPHQSGHFPPFRYYTFDIKGVPGRTYRIVADYEDLHAEAECTMPFPTSIDSIAVRSIQGNDSLRSATLHFTAPADCPAYFCVTLRDLDPRGRPLPAMMGCVRADVPGVHMELPLLRPKNSLDTVPFIPQFTIGQRYDVTLCRVSPEVYEFWDGYNDLTIFGGSQFVSASSSLRGNIRGGFGVWSAQGASTGLLEVK